MITKLMRAVIFVGEVGLQILVQESLSCLLLNFLALYSDGFWTISRMYSVLVGDVSLDYFQSSSLMLVVFIFFSFFCIIILLNILIAIIIDSYERTKERSREIFGRAQVEYAAALVARNQFIRVSVKRSRNSSAIFRNRS